MQRTLIIFVTAALMAACDSGGSKDAGTDVPDDGTDTVTDTAADPAPDTVTDTAPDTAEDSAVDTVEEEAAAVCGNLEVETGEQCDPPGLDAPCTTTCGTRGEGTCTTTCQEAAPADCVPPTEKCNLVDEDCDTLVDEGARGSWDRLVLLGSDADARVGSVDVTPTDDGYAAAWVVSAGGGSPDEIHLAVTDPLGNLALPDTTLELTGVDSVVGRPALVHTGTDLLVAYLSPTTGRNVARVGLDAGVASEHSVAATAPGDVDAAWSGSAATLVWVEELDGDPEVHTIVVDDDGVDVGTAVRVTESTGGASQVHVDATSTATALVWIDSRSGDDQVHRAVLDDAGAIIVADGPLTTTGGAVSPAVSASQRLVVFVDDHDGTPKAWSQALDGSWDPLGTALEVTESDLAALTSPPGGLAMGASATILELETDGEPASGALTTGLQTVRTLAMAVPSIAAVGEDASSDILMALAGCEDHRPCTGWTTTVTASETRAGADPVQRVVAHDAALEGFFDARPVTYLSIQIYQADPHDGPTSTGGYLLTGLGYEDCGLCVLVYEGCSATTCDAVYLATGGKLVIDEMGTVGDTFSGTLVNAQLAQVDLDPSSRTSSWIEDGDVLCLGEYSFSSVLGEI